MSRIALLGMPNTGKSTLFNRLTGASSRIGNWPGITIQLLSAKIKLGAKNVEIVDLPGIYDLHGYSEDEKVVRHFLEKEPIDLLLVILNARQLERQLTLPLQLAPLSIPMVVAVNMIDEAKQDGVDINTATLSEGLGAPAISISAKYGEGEPEILEALTGAINKNEESKISTTSLQELTAHDLLEEKAAAIVQSSVSQPAVIKPGLSDRLDAVLMHHIFGLPIFFLAMYGVFSGVFRLGTPIQDAMKQVFDWFSQNALSPLLAGAPDLVKGFLIGGLYGGVTTVAAFVPVIVLFFFFMAIIEDSGYLSRAAYLMDALMNRTGLDGRSFVMLLMGFGCNVPAIMGLRVMRSKALRMLSMLVIPFSLCSARLQVFLFIIAALFRPDTAPTVLFSLYLVSFASAFLTAMLFKGQPRFQSDEPFVIELPPYRIPTLKQVWMRGWLEVHHFLSRATRFIIGGVVAVWFLTNMPPGAAPAGPDTLAGMIGRITQPIFGPIGIDPKLTIALIFGFVAKEVVIGALAVIYGLEGNALTQQLAHSLNWIEAYSFMLFCLIYTPCLSTIATIKSESRDIPFTIFSVAWPLGLAWTTSFVFYQVAHRLFPLV